MIMRDDSWTDPGFGMARSQVWHWPRCLSTCGRSVSVLIGNNAPGVGAGERGDGVIS